MTSPTEKPAETAASSPGGSNVSAEETGAGTPAEAPDFESRLEAGLQAAKTESEHWRDRCLRKAAELENFRKRMERERSEAAILVKASVLGEFLPVMDACERALTSFETADGQSDRLQKYREGVELLYRQLESTLNRLGVVAMETEGQPFDPHLHEALTYLETMEQEDHTVVQELRRGYMLQDRLLRPAQVVVAKRPKPDSDTSGHT